MFKMFKYNILQGLVPFYLRIAYIIMYDKTTLTHYNNNHARY